MKQGVLIKDWIYCPWCKSEVDAEDIYIRIEDYKPIKVTCNECHSNYEVTMVTKYLLEKYLKI